MDRVPDFYSGCCRFDPYPADQTKRYDVTSKKSPEMKAMLGVRESEDDGFTYRYGAHKGGYTKKPRHTESNKQSVRHDKRSVKQKENKRIKKDENIE